MWSIFCGSLDIVLILLDYGADVNAQANVSNRMMMMMMMMMMIVICDDDRDDDNWYYTSYIGITRHKS